jgi:predicted component of viral defense system (DUF524 family)
MVTPVSGANAEANTWLTLNNIPLSFTPGDENLAAHAGENVNNRLRITSPDLDQLEIRIDDELLQTTFYGYWHWHPRGHAGIYQIVVNRPGFPLQIALVRVFPEKLTQERYEAMLADLRTFALDLLFRLSSLTGEKAIAEPEQAESSPYREFIQVKGIIDALQDVMELIRRNPYCVLREEQELRTLREVHQFSSVTLPIPGTMARLPSSLADRYATGYLPEKWIAQTTILTYDVYENRLLKHFVQRQLVTRLAMLQKRAENEMRRREQSRLVKIQNKWHDDETPEIEKLQQAITECRQMMRRCIFWADEAYLTSVHPLALTGKATQVLLKNPAYSRFYLLYLRFQQHLRISLDTERFLTMLAMRKIWDLYEFWSVFQVTQIVIERLEQAGYTMTSNSVFYEIERGYFQFDVRRNVSSIVLTKGERRVEIKYEPRYPNQKTLVNVSGLAARLNSDNPLTPDMAIEVYVQGQPSQIVIFDAKYRWRREKDGSYHPKDEDLNKMRQYRDLIQYKIYDKKIGLERWQQIVSSAYVLYPGESLDRDPGMAIGALPMIPDMTAQQRHEVQQAVIDILQVARLLES